MRVNPFTKTYNKKTAVSFPGFDFKEGKIYAVIGANGSGKSTFAKTVAGIIPADRKVKPLGRKTRTGYLPQKSYMFGMSVSRNIRLNGKDGSEASALADRLGLKELNRKNAHRLSGGEAAKTALARLLMGRYELLILDEPTASMDMESTSVTEALISEYRDRTGCAVILITHSVSQAGRIADELLFFSDGELAASGPCGELIANPPDGRLKKFLDFVSAGA